MRFFRTPKGLLLLVFAGLVAVAAPVEGVRVVAPGLVAAVVVSAAIDAVILRWRDGRWSLPSGAILTALIVAMILTSHEPWFVVVLTSVLGVLSKYLIRAGGANVFNPAALGLVATFYVFNTGQSWWGAMPELPTAAVALLIAGGVFITDRVNKVPLVLAFLGAYYLCFAVAAFAGQPQHVAEIFRAPDLQASLYFAFFILTDPPTSPVRHRDQVVCGVIVALVSYAVFEGLGAAYYLLAGALAGNVYETARRWHARRQRVARRPVAFAQTR
jgi:Na+-translocating ferredoxin:NAD+ oxidoreductase RnfD subunit